MLFGMSMLDNPRSIAICLCLLSISSGTLPLFISASTSQGFVSSKKLSAVFIHSLTSSGKLICIQFLHQHKCQNKSYSDSIRVDNKLSSIFYIQILRNIFIFQKGFYHLVGLLWCILLNMMRNAFEISKRQI